MIAWCAACGHVMSQDDVRLGCPICLELNQLRAARDMAEMQLKHVTELLDEASPIVPHALNGILLGVEDRVRYVLEDRERLVQLRVILREIRMARIWQQPWPVGLRERVEKLETL